MAIIRIRQSPMLFISWVFFVLSLLLTSLPEAREKENCAGCWLVALCGFVCGIWAVYSTAKGNCHPTRRSSESNRAHAIHVLIWVLAFYGLVFVSLWPWKVYLGGSSDLDAQPLVLGLLLILMMSVVEWTGEADLKAQSTGDCEHTPNDRRDHTKGNPK